MSTVSRGFKGRRRPTAKLPPGQYLVEDFPSCGGEPPASTSRTGSCITSETKSAALDWTARALPQTGTVTFTASPTVKIHTPGRGALDTRWRAWTPVQLALVSSYAAQHQPASGT